MGASRSTHAKRGRPRKSAEAPPSAEQLRRLRFIERAALWTGRIGRRVVASTFDVSVSHVSVDLNRYRTMAPHNLAYDVAQKCFRPTERFEPIFDVEDPGDLLATIAATVSLPEQERTRLLGFDLPVEGIRSLPVSVDRILLATICRSIIDGSMLEVSYQSLSTPEPARRQFVPHALIFTGQRWLVRGWDGRHGSYRDLSLARFLSAWETERVATLPRDDLWHDRAKLELVPAAHLSTSQIEVVAREYGMSQTAGGGHTVALMPRQALVPYLLDYLHLRPGDLLASENPVHLSNYPDIVQFDRHRRPI